MRKPPATIESVSDEMAEVFRSMSGAERLAVASGMFASARRMLCSHLRAEHPEWDEDRVTKEAARRLALGTG